MDAGARNWLFKTAKSNYWRVASPSIDFDDIIQDGFWQYYRIKARYPDVTDRRHLMGLFKITYLNYIHTLSKRRTREFAAAVDMLHWVEGFMELEGATYHTLCVNAPEPIKAVLKLFEQEESLRRLRSLYRVRQRETFNERLCRLTGLDPSQFDLPSMIRAYFSGESDAAISHA